MFGIGISRIQSSIMAKLGFVGLGLMGSPMARSLLKGGHEVALWSNTRANAEKLAAEEGGKVCASPAEVARNSLNRLLKLARTS